MEPKILHIEEKQLIGMRLETSMANNRTGELWRNFMPMLKEIQNSLNIELRYSINVYGDGFKMHHFKYDTIFEKWAAIEVLNFNSVPEGMETRMLKGGKYAVFNHKGPVSTFYKTSGYIFGEWLPGSDYELDDKDHFEILGEKYLGPMDPNSEEEVWIPVK